MQNPGPLLRPALEKLIVPRAKLRGVAAAVGLDPKTVIREAMAAGIAAPWATKPSGRPIPRSAPIANALALRRPHTGRTRRDWPARAEDLAMQLRSAALDIAAIIPPVRAAREGYFAKRKAKSPLSSALLDALAEDVMQFQRRRIRYWMDQAGSDARPWWIARAAGLKCGNLAMVREEMAVRPFLSRHTRMPFSTASTNRPLH